MTYKVTDYQHLPSVIELGWEPYWGKSNTLVSVEILGRFPKVQDFWIPAAEAFNQVLIRTNYENPCDWIGSYRIKPIVGTRFWSWHCYTAFDLDYGGDNPDSPDHPGIDKNPHIHRQIVRNDPGFGVEWQISELQVDAIEAIRTNNGKRVWRWLGWSIGDTMHFQPMCSRADIETGIDPQSIIGAVMDPNCPWTNTGNWKTTYPQCRHHYDAGLPLEWDVNTGVCNIQEWAQDDVQKMIDCGAIKLADNNRDDGDNNLTDLRYWVMEGRRL